MGIAPFGQGALQRSLAGLVCDLDPFQFGIADSSAALRAIPCRTPGAQPLTATPAQLKAARLLLGFKSQAALAKKLGVPQGTVNAGERAIRGARNEAADRLQAYFEAQGVEFMSEPPGVRMRSNE